MSYINQIDLCEAIAAKLVALWPTRTLYRDFCPSDFQRPSGFLYVTQAGFTDAALGLVKWDVELELEIFCATDSYDEQSTEQLRQEQAAVLEAFGGPSLPVGDRHVTVAALADGAGPGAAYVKFSASWMDHRPGYHDPEDRDDPVTGAIPLMEHYALDVETAGDTN